jgi:hypothetical protein
LLIRITVSIIVCLFIFSCISSPSASDELVVFLQDSSNSEEAAQELAYAHARKQIEKLVVAPLQTIKKRGKMLLNLVEINGDSYPEAVVVCVETRYSAYADFAFLANYARLKNEKPKIFPFYLLTFKNNQGKLSLANKTLIGDKSVLKSLELRPFYKIDPSFLLCKVEFYTREGSEGELLVISGPEMIPVHNLTTQETYTSSSAIIDIDNDAIIDIITSKKQAEDGIGYETIMNWYRFNGQNFALFQKTSILRNLKSFFLNIKKFVLRKEMTNFVNYALTPAALDKLKENGLSNYQIAIKALNLNQLLKQSTSSASSFINRIKDIVFPNIYENPFSYHNENGYYFKLTYKIIDVNDVPYILETLIYLNQNPFDQRQFVFYP